MFYSSPIDRLLYNNLTRQNTGHISGSADHNFEFQLGTPGNMSSDRDIALFWSEISLNGWKRYIWGLGMRVWPSNFDHLDYTIEKALTAIY